MDLFKNPVDGGTGPISSETIEKEIRGLQPHIIINRVV
jgi:hypothetical protein